MSNSFNCDFEKFLSAVEPIITKYQLKKDEKLTGTIHECFNGLQEINSDDKRSIKQLLHEIIQFIGKNKIDDQDSSLINEVCMKLGLKFNEIEKKIGALKKINNEMLEKFA